MKLPLSIASALIIATSSFGAICETTADYWPAEYTAGDDNINVAFYGDLSLLNNCTQQQADVHAGAASKLYSIDVEIIDAAAGASLEDYNIFAINGEIAVFGMVVDDFSYDFTAEISYGDTLSFPVEISDKQIFFAGPIPIGVDYGIIGEGGLEYNANLRALALGLDVIPFVKTSVFAAAGIDAIIASVKVRGELALINDSFNTNLILAIDQETFDRAFFTAYGENEFSALDGSIDLIAEVGIDPLKESYDLELYAWKGYSIRDEAFNVESDIPFPN